jgi:hypothetical protein
MIEYIRYGENKKSKNWWFKSIILSRNIFTYNFDKWGKIFLIDFITKNYNLI